MTDGHAVGVWKTHSDIRSLAEFILCCFKAAMPSFDSRMVRRPVLVLGGLITPSYTLLLTLSVPASKSISFHINPSSSPCRIPVVIAKTYRASSLSPLAASRSERICSCVSGSISCLTERGAWPHQQHSGSVVATVPHPSKPCGWLRVCSVPFGQRVRPRASAYAASQVEGR
jgi:hypothetical protein